MAAGSAISLAPKVDRRLESGALLFVTLLAVLSTILGYRYGSGNQVENLPIVLRLLDDSYLQNDFFVESATRFGPRFYYAQLLATLACAVPLPIVLVVLTLVVNWALAAITYFAARDLLQADRLSGFIAAFLAVCVSSFGLGMVTDIRFDDLQPGSLAIPPSLAALWAALKGRPLRAAGLASFASIWHPLYGVESGAIALGTSAAHSLLQTGPRPTFATLVRSLVPTCRGTALLAASTAILWGLPTLRESGGAIATSETLQILAYFRAPHHYIPSLFPLRQYIGFLAFLGASGLAWQAWKSSRAGPPEDYALLVGPAAVLLGCIGGYLFVEVWPSRAWTTAQPFRLLYLVKWQGFLFLAWLIARWLQGGNTSRKILAGVALFASGGAHAPLALLCVGGERLEARIRRFLPTLPALLLPGVASVAAVAVLPRYGSSLETTRIALAMAIALPLVRGAKSSRRRYILPVSLVGLVLAVAAVNRSVQRIGWQALNPIVVPADHRGDDADVARWARDHTPEGALFVTPPGLGSFRLLAHRAIVVDFKALPFEAGAMREWRKRVLDCYGDVDAAGGFAALQELERNFVRVSDVTLASLAERYGAGFAVLFAESPTPRRVLYANQTYKIVEL